MNPIAYGLALVILAGLAVAARRRAEHYREELALAQQLLDRAVATEVAPREVLLSELAVQAGFRSYEFLAHGYPMVILMPNRDVPDAEGESVLKCCAFLLREFATACEGTVATEVHRRALLTVNATGGKA